MLTAEQKHLVEEALSADESEDRLAEISRMTSEQLHAFMLRYNWDDGFIIPGAVLDHAGFERGTSLQIYYAKGGPLAEKDAKGDHSAFLAETRSRLLSGAFPEHVIAYDPAVDGHDQDATAQAPTIECIRRADQAIPSEAGAEPRNEPMKRTTSPQGHGVESRGRLCGDLTADRQPVRRVWERICICDH